MRTSLLPICFSLLLGTCFSALAQQTAPVPSYPDAARAAAALTKYPEPVLLVNDQETRLHAFISDPNNILRLDVYKGDKALKKFGPIGKEGVLLVTLKQAIPLARLPEVYDTFQVPAQQQKLSLAINGQHVANPEQLLADIRQIEKVEVTAFDVLSPTRWSLAPEYLNIVTKQQP